MPETVSKDLLGKKILITAGRAHEDIDGVRHYANHKRPEGHGYAVAEALAARGADVTLVSAKNHFMPPSGCRVIRKTNEGKDLCCGQDIMAAAENTLAQGSFDAVLCLASIPSIRPEQKAANKLKVKHNLGDPVTMAVIGNMDIQVRARAWNLSVLGYDTHQEKFSSPDLPDWLVDLTPTILEKQNAAFPPRPHRDDDIGPSSATLFGKTILMTSGPTEEMITASGDVITNFSSGRQGYDLARAFANEGASVTYVVGPTYFPAPAHDNIKTVHVHSARSMLAACEAHVPADIFVGVAAVADFGCKNPPDLRLPEGQRYDLVLDQNPDILSTMGHHAQRPGFVVGFAAETDPANIMAYAQGKLEKKGADMICANLVGPAIAARGATNNQVIILSRDAEPFPLANMSKTGTAQAIVEQIKQRLSVTCHRPSAKLGPTEIKEPKF
ncbi:MAG: phosphopantothenoylcysteine decarboxylase [Alphaproteobacteria bacterium]|nr:phosphopantothenoylcysteine decarboxylase [Alphaproteobacteria bacterium]